MSESRDYNKLHARIEELEQQVADLQRVIDELTPQYKELARYVADLRTRVHAVEEKVEHLTWRSAA